jgi:RNA polymerase primary sigma factor
LLSTGVLTGERHLAIFDTLFGVHSARYVRMTKPKARKPARKAPPVKPAKTRKASEPLASGASPAPADSGAPDSTLGSLPPTEALPPAILPPGERIEGVEDAVPGVPPRTGEFNVQDKVKELVKLAQEQGYLTYNDINDALPDGMVTPEELDEIYIKLRNLEIEIVDQSEVDRVKQPEVEEEDEKARLDILDDPVRMYLKQMGQVPLLTREQEVEISKRIEDAENEVKRLIYSFGFSGKEHIALAEKLIAEPPKERFDRVIIDKKIDSRDLHLKVLRKLVKDVRALDQEVDDQYRELLGSSQKGKQEKLREEFQKLDAKLQKSFPKFYYKQKVIEEMALVADNVHDKFQLSLKTIGDLDPQKKMPQVQMMIDAERRKVAALEEFVRMSCEGYLQTYRSCRISPARRSRPRPRWSRPTSAS